MSETIAAMAAARIKDLGVPVTGGPEQVVPAVEEDVPSWRKVTDDDIRQVIAGTALEILADAAASVTDPPLSIRYTLPKALVLAGCALSQPVEFDSKNPEEHRRGVELCRLLINTAGGQTCNIWAMMVGESGCGKDIGPIPELPARRYGWLVGTAGSAEGLADALSVTGNGLVRISELENYLDSKHWQSGATSFLTGAFNKGFFCVALSRRQGGNREANYCFPNLLANVQPEVLVAKTDRFLLDTGFLPRFLVVRLPVESWRPACISVDAVMTECRQAINLFAVKDGVVKVPDKYLNYLYDELHVRKAPFRSHWTRLVNEYGPRFAVMLSVRRGDATPAVVLEDRCWEGAATLVRWFYSMAEDVFAGVQQGGAKVEFNKRVQQVYEYIAKRQEVMRADISRRFSKISSAAERNIWIAELADMGLVKEGGNKFRITGALPPWS